MASLVDACIFIAASAGTGSFVVSSPVPGWRTPASAGAANGATYRYRAYSADQSEWEVGTGVYTSGTTTLTRAVILASSNAGAAVNFAVAPSVALTVFSEDFATPAQLAKVDYLTVTASTDLDTIRTKAGYLTVTGATDLDTIRTSVAALGTAATKNTGTSSGQVPILDGSGLLATSVLPAIAVTDTFVVASQAAMLALTAEKGDIAIRTDTSETYVLSTNSPSTLADWKELIAPTDDKMAKAQNLNDVADKPTAFSNIKQAASLTATGVVELATDAETVALTDTSRSVTPSNLAAFLADNPGAVAQQFTSSGTWTKPVKGTIAWVFGWGGGGAGARGGSSPRAGGGGGGGGWNETRLLLSSLTSTVAVTIGAGGPAVVSPNGNSTAGGNTTFGGYFTAFGGGGADGNTSSNDGGGGGGGGGRRGAGGSATSKPGGTGGLGWTSAAANTDGGEGGGGGGGSEGTSPAGNGNGGGGGGGGGGSATTSTAGAGGSSFNGGGGGGGANDDGTAGAGGISLLGGNGGAGANSSSTATSGVAPGGGGGGSASGTSGAGARGELWVIVI